MNRLNQTIKYIREKTDLTASVGIVLGSGLGSLTHHIDHGIKFPYKTLPHFVASTAPWHEGSLITGTLFGHKVVVMNGRFHPYEGYSVEEITYPIWVMKKLGIKKLFVTNAAGAVNKTFLPGDLMVITDHINLLDISSLYKVSLMKKEETFINASSIYDKQLSQVAQKCAFSLGIRMHEGIYAVVKGPSFETPAETRMLSLLGADAVGMSTVPEVLIAKHLDIKVLGISCITNRSGENFLTHQKVVKVSKNLSQNLTVLIKEIFKKM